MATWLDDIVDALTALGGTSTLPDIYSEVEGRRSSLPASWRDIIRRQIQDRSSDSVGFRGGADLFFSVQGLGHGVWGLRGLVADTPQAEDLDGGSTVPQRGAQLTYRILRDTALARQIKLLHRDECQLCGESLRLSASDTYSEAHHIIPLGAPHSGPDVADNIIVLCPNHHALCDYGAIRLDFARIKQVGGHQISAASVDYHNKKIFERRFGAVL